MPFIYRRRVQFYETDAQGIVHHSNYFRYFEEARGEFLRSRGLPYSEFRKRGLEVVLLTARCEYKKPLYYDDEFEIHLTLKDLTRFTFSFEYEVLKEGESVSYGETKHCIVKEGKIVSIPEDVRSILG
ncbi:YbgC/FadM family acyl-CoA thioesterase [Aquifex pyrophilus]